MQKNPKGFVCDETLSPGNFISGDHFPSTVS